MMRSHIKVYVTPEEKEVLKERAAICNVSVSRYLKSTAFAERQISKEDYKLAMEFTKAAGVMGKYVGVLMMQLRKHEYVNDRTVEELRNEMGYAIQARINLMNGVKKIIGKYCDSEAH